ncbi:MAG: hypothetical protein JW744_05555 [Candidatus Diapherotrites archaeon]|uniref:Uncharacterized protein n=1 Tax=Candidatus Iainarchaeum sp. TaxID=3101447 RepID=A0A939C9B6_9ARCH|nr:hypothetical protein [Candidatus Diapherotrites archaeon]
MLSKQQKRIAIAYLALQAAVWAKSMLFFAWFGHGKAMEYSMQAFSNEALQFDFIFHNSVHVLIGLLAIGFGASLRNFELRKPGTALRSAGKLAAFVLAAVAVHNFAYWFTAVHPSIEYSAFDFARDCALLLAAVVAGYAVKAAWLKIKCKQNN